MILWEVTGMNDARGKKLPEEYFIPFPSERNDPLLTKENVQEYIDKYRWFE